MLPLWGWELYGFLLFPFLIFLTYWESLSGSWVSDDILGIATYDGKLQQPISWHNIFKWLRFHAAKHPNPNRNWKKDGQKPYLPHARLHHRLNLWIFSGVACLLYFFLLQLFPWKVAYFATLLFIVHPLGCQTVGWISGIGYLTATFFMLLGLNFVLLSDSFLPGASTLATLGSFILFAFFQWMAVEAMFQTIGATFILFWLGYTPFAVISLLISCYGLVSTFRSAISLRTKIFHEQKMAQSTFFHPAKLIVVLKTLYYNFFLAIFPKRLGLYHTFGYHYELPYIETWNRHSLAGLLIAAGLIAAIFLTPPAIALGCLWFLSFICLFLNWITANQFVVDRYAWLPAAGLCLILAYLLPIPAILFLIGMALVRTWVHLPTYENETKFYLSNLWNFPTSEVAAGNLGVTYLQNGQIGSAIDTWSRGIQLNPEYDVSWYNLFSLFASRGPFNPNYAPQFFSSLPKDVLTLAFEKDPAQSHLHIAHYCLKQAVSVRTSHFPEQWQKELDRLEQQLLPKFSGRIATLINPLITAALT